MRNQSALLINGRRYTVGGIERFNPAEGWFSRQAFDERTGFQFRIWEFRGENALLEGAREKAEKLARLKIPGLPLVYDVVSEQGKLVLVTDKVAGYSLRECLPALHGAAAPDLPALVEYGRGICVILGRLHAHFAHRGLQPESIVVNGSRVVLADLGLAFMPAGFESEKLPYRAPEQLAGRSESVGRRTDIYTFGLILDEMLTGRRPDRPGCREPSGGRREIPGQLKEVIMRCTRDEADGRPGSIEEVKRGLSEWLLFARGERSIIHPGALPAPESAPGSPAAGRFLRRLAAKRAVWLVVAPLLLLQPVLMNGPRHFADRPLPLAETAVAKTGPYAGRQAMRGELTRKLQEFRSLTAGYNNAKIPGSPEKTAWNFRQVENKAGLLRDSIAGITAADKDLAEAMAMFEELKTAAGIFADYLEGKKKTTVGTDWVEEAGSHYRKALELQNRIEAKMASQELR